MYRSKGNIFTLILLEDKAIVSSWGGGSLIKQMGQFGEVKHVDISGKAIQVEETISETAGQGLKGSTGATGFLEGESQLITGLYWVLGDTDKSHLYFIFPAVRIHF